MAANMKPPLISPSGMSDMPEMMEHAENTMAVPPLVDDRVLMQFCQAVQSYADNEGTHNEVAEKIRELQVSLANLRNLAILCRLAIVGHPLSFARVVDEMYCLSVDFPSHPLEELNDDECEFCRADDRVQLAAAVDLFAGAAFVSKDDPCQRDRFIIGIVRAIEDAIAFPVTFSAEAVGYLGLGTGEISSNHDSIVIGNATQRLIESDQKCIPRVPAEIRMRLERLAIKWMWANPVSEFFKVVSGPKVRHIVRWENSSRDQQDKAIIGDPVTLLLHSRSGDKEPTNDLCGENLRDLSVMFCPHQPAQVVRVIKNGLQVRIPEQASTGPVAVVQNVPDFSKVWQLLWEYAQLYPVEFSSSIFSLVRMDVWAYPFAFGCPIIEIAHSPTDITVSTFTSAGPLMIGHRITLGETVAIHYHVNHPGSAEGVTMNVNASEGVVTHTGKPGVLLYRPLSQGNQVIELTWGNIKKRIGIGVKPAPDTGNGTT